VVAGLSRRESPGSGHPWRCSRTTGARRVYIAAEESREPFAQVIEEIPAFRARSKRLRPGSPGAAVKVDHEAVNALRLRPCRGGIVQINQLIVQWLQFQVLSPNSISWGRPSFSVACHLLPETASLKVNSHADGWFQHDSLPRGFQRTFSPGLRHAAALAKCGDARIVAAYANWFEAPLTSPRAACGAGEPVSRVMGRPSTV